MATRIWTILETSLGKTLATEILWLYASGRAITFKNWFWRAFFIKLTRMLYLKRSYLFVILFRITYSFWILCMYSTSLIRGDLGTKWRIRFSIWLDLMKYFIDIGQYRLKEVVANTRSDFQLVRMNLLSSGYWCR